MKSSPPANSKPDFARRIADTDPWLPTKELNSKRCRFCDKWSVDGWHRSDCIYILAIAEVAAADRYDLDLALPC